MKKLKNMKIINFDKLTDEQIDRLTNDIKTVNINIKNEVKKYDVCRVCDVCGSSDVIEAPHMGLNCNTCNPL